MSIRDSLAYVGEGQVLTIVDVSNPAQPTRRSELPLAGNVYGIQLVNNLAYTVSRQQASYEVAKASELAIVDVGNPASPALRGRYLLEGQVDELQVINSFGYLTIYKDTGTSELQIVDIRDPVNPALRGRYIFPPHITITESQVIGNYAYLVILDDITDRNWLQILDVTNPTNIKPRGTIVIPGLVVSHYGWPLGNGMQVVAPFAYVITFEKRFLVIDISDPDSLVLRAQVDTEVTDGALGIQVLDGFAYIAFSSGTTGQFLIFDVHDPATPVRRGSYVTWSIFELQVVGSLAYLIAGYKGQSFEIVDVSDPDQPVRRSSNGVRLYAHVQVANGLVYLVDEWGGFQILDVSDPNSPKVLGIYGGAWAVNTIHVENNQVYLIKTLHVFVLTNAVMDIFDVHNPGAPARLSSYYSGLEAVNNLQVVDSRAYVAGSGSGLEIVDVSDPNSPMLRGRETLPNEITHLEVVGDFAYVTSKDGRLSIIDVSNPITPTLRSSYDTLGQANSVRVVNNLAYIADGSSGLQILDISNPASPTLRGSYDTPGNATYVDVVNNLAYIGDGDQGLQIVAVGDPAHPSLQGSYMLPAPITDLQVAGDFAYIAAGSAGLQILDVATPSDPLLYASYALSASSASDVQVVGDLVYLASGLSGVQILRFVPPAKVSTAIPISGGVLRSPSDTTSYHFPAGVFSETVTVTHSVRATDMPLPKPSNNLISIGHIFRVDAVARASGQFVQPARPYTLTVQYTDAERGPAIEPTLAFYFWDGSRLIREASSTVDFGSRTVTATPSKFALWAVLGETKRVFLPLVHH
jgi:hypothetical protein